MVPRMRFSVSGIVASWHCGLVACHLPTSDDQHSTQTASKHKTLKTKAFSSRHTKQNKQTKNGKQKGRQDRAECRGTKVIHPIDIIDSNHLLYLASKLFGRNPGRDAAYEDHLVRVRRKLLRVHIVFAAAILYHVNIIFVSY